MSIVTKIESISNHLENAYNSLENIGIDLTNVNKNIENLSAQIESIYEDLPKTSTENTDITLNSTKKGKMQLTLKGNTKAIPSTGKNKLNYSLENLKNLNKTGVWTDNIYTLNGITFVINDDLSVSINGVATSVTTLILTTSLSLTNETEYILSGCSAGGSTTGYSIRIYTPNYGSYKSNTDLNGLTFTYENQPIIRINIANGTSVDNKLFQPMIRLSSISENKYEPYTGEIASPNTNYPQEIQTVTKDNNLYIKTENYFDGELEIGSYSGAGDKISNASHIRSKNFIPVAPSTKYRFSVNGSGKALWINMYGKRHNFLQRILKNTTQYLTTTEETYYITFRNNEESSDTSIKIMMNKGETIQNYVAPVSQIYPINLGDIELCKIGNYEDYIYENSGNWYKYSVIGKAILNGNQGTYWNATNRTNTTRFLVQNAITDDNGLNDYVKSNYFIAKESAYSSDVEGMYLASSHVLYFSVDNSVATTVSEFKTWLSTHNTIIYYILATPTTVQITDTVLINQLNSLKENCKSYNNTTNILQTNNNLPFIISASALSQNNS